MTKRDDDFQARQGDVFLMATDRAAEGEAVKREGDALVLAHGEATGHRHAIYGARGGAAMYRPDDMPAGNFVLEIAKDGIALKHEEHGKIDLAPGCFEVRRQVEWGDEQEPIVVED